MLRQERVCVVGAGPAGVYMTYSLKRRGYSSVVVLERSGRVWGKCLDSHYRGVVWPLGEGSPLLTTLATSSPWRRSLASATTATVGPALKY